MNVQELFDAIGEADDAQILSAREPIVKKAKRRWAIGAVAAALAVCVALGAFWRPQQSSPKRLLVTTQIGVCAQVAQAAEPPFDPYPDSALMTAPEMVKARKAWSAAFKEKNDVFKEAKIDIEKFYTASAKAFLTDAGSENTIYSPLNVYMAMAMLAEITDGDSRKQLLDALQVESIDELRDTVGALWTAHYYDDEEAKRLTANSLWLRDDLGYVEETVAVLAQQYYASVFQGTMGSDEMNDLLRNWISENVNGFLDEYSNQLELSAATVLALASTLYFKANWAVDDCFDKAITKSATFHGATGDSECEFMHNLLSKDVYEGQTFSAVSLEFQDHTESLGNLWFVLPDEGISPENLLASSQVIDCVTNPEAWENTQERKRVQLTVPKFDVSSSFDLQKGMEAMGIKNVFSPSESDFSYITDKENVYVSEAEHSARVSIDEKGCEAASYTIFETRDGGTLTEIVEFTVDRPFVFVITSEVGVPLFIGIVNQI